MIRPTPRIEVDLSKVAYNAKRIIELYRSKGIEIMGVTKGVGGCAEIAHLLCEQGIEMLADTKLQNLKKMKQVGVKAAFVLLRTPSLSEAAAVVRVADISMNTELKVMEALSAAAVEQKLVHKVILMVEMGDLREGLMPADLEETIRAGILLEGIKITGIGANFACFGGIRPNQEKMIELSMLAERMEAKFSLSFSCITGGNSGNYHWFTAADDTAKINNLRIGESIYLGCETLDREEIPGLYTDAFTLYAEVIEVKTKPSKPYGDAGQDVAGNYPQFEDEGLMRRAIVAVGSQDAAAAGLKPKIDADILGSSSDHLILNAKSTGLTVGEEVAFQLNYSALLSLMTSSYISKTYIGSENFSDEQYSAG
ncbi:alanine/ornithine racemase family PLP-dependent enzyme [Alkalicoccus daliensis]|uniref:Predicted amino acid racemase n=1 Tax=Alkalicoccus daliensis TaxID=745820 RepID=A0A1H0GTV9_9BACI|nr:alanine/ornithine racemase family PLP-dependent enzyme [Alkalicoccus daliensis]SDO10327.1 Predicted amino acid racemase [Alkalicoccus daliensis]